MDNQEDGRVVPTGLSQAEPEDSLGPPGFDPSRGEVWAAAILIYLPNDASPKLYLSGGPSAAAALGACFAMPSPGFHVAAKLTHLIGEYELSDSDGSPKGGDGEAGSVACDDSAGPKDIAQPITGGSHVGN